MRNEVSASVARCVLFACPGFAYPRGEAATRRVRARAIALRAGVLLGRTFDAGPFAIARLMASPWHRRAPWPGCRWPRADRRGPDPARRGNRNAGSGLVATT